MQKIKIQIGGRQYPITVSVEEEFFVRKASKKIEKLIFSLESKYSVSDRQDSLAMVALQFATKYETYKYEINKNLLETQKKINELNSLIT